MKPRVLSFVLAAALCAVAGQTAATSRPPVRKPHGEHWEMAGRLSEACSCSVPCTCNFGQGPSPHHYCWAMFALDIEHGHYGKVSLDGLHLVGAHGKKSKVWYIDERATPQQAAALRAITLDLDWHSTTPVYWEVARITQKIGEKCQEVQVGGHGGFTADYLIGMDGKTPIILENNPSWNIQHGIKAKAQTLAYQDQHGNHYRYAGVNSNEGKFDWTDQTPEYF